jgi:hypothetical protein
MRYDPALGLHAIANRAKKKQLHPLKAGSFETGRCRLPTFVGITNQMNIGVPSDEQS